MKKDIVFYLFSFIISILLFACNTTTLADENVIKTIEIKDSIIYDSRINLDSLLNHKPDYFNYENNKLTTCCYDLLDITPSINLNNSDTSWIKIQGEDVKIIKSNGLELYKYFNSHPELNRDDLAKGFINSNDGLKEGKIKIGMNKNELLELIFRPSARFEEIKSITLLDSEEENFTTTYSFGAGRLKKIEFGSDYDWI